MIDLIDLLELLWQKRYLPSRVWKLYKTVKGDKGTNRDGTARKCLRLVEREKKEDK